MALRSMLERAACPIGQFTPHLLSSVAAAVIWSEFEAPRPCRWRGTWRSSNPEPDLAGSARACSGAAEAANPACRLGKGADGPTGAHRRWEALGRPWLHLQRRYQRRETWRRFRLRRWMGRHRAATAQHQLERERHGGAAEAAPDLPQTTKNPLSYGCADGQVAWWMHHEQQRKRRWWWSSERGARGSRGGDTHGPARGFGAAAVQRADQSAQQYEDRLRGVHGRRGDARLGSVWA